VTYLSSRAFPSSILSPTPSLASTPASPAHPVLLPGVDALNHARGHAVSWVVDRAASEEDAAPTLVLSLVLHDPVRSGAELFNNYGPKPNAELVLAYGFSIPNNPDDTIVLRVGGGGAALQGRSWEVGRGARGAEGMWAEVLEFMRNESGGGGEEQRSFEDELDAAGMLDYMLTQLISRLPTPRDCGEEGAMRDEVFTMWKDYVQGFLDDHVLRKRFLMILHFMCRAERHFGDHCGVREGKREGNHQSYEGTWC
jgi:hypothetical protein